jgi:hypothetical protein
MKKKIYIVLSLITIVSLATSSCKKTDECVELYGENYAEVNYVNYDTSLLNNFEAYNNVTNLYFKRYKVILDSITGEESLQLIDTLNYTLKDSFEYYTTGNIVRKNDLCYDFDSLLYLTKIYENQFNDKLELLLTHFDFYTELYGVYTYYTFFNDTSLNSNKYLINEFNIENIIYDNVHKLPVSDLFQFIVLSKEYGVLQVRKLKDDSSYYLLNRIYIP